MNRPRQIGDSALNCISQNAGCSWSGRQHGADTEVSGISAGNRKPFSVWLMYIRQREKSYKRRHLYFPYCLLNWAPDSRQEKEENAIFRIRGFKPLYLIKRFFEAKNEHFAHYIFIRNFGWQFTVGGQQTSSQENEGLGISSQALGKLGIRSEELGMKVRCTIYIAS